MKKAFRILAVIVGILVLALAGVITYVKLALPDVGEAPTLQIEVTPERVERGRYLANAVTVCMDCHSVRDWSKFSGPIKPGTEGMGGERFDHTMGFPGTFYSKNITPSGISRYSDGELYRLITSGVTKEGRAIFPLMPYPYYSRMDNEDVYAIIAYLRTLRPVDNPVADSEVDFPMSLILNTIPSKNNPTQRPAKEDVLAYGGYLTNVAACKECHTQVEQGRIIEARAFSGGRVFSMPDGSVLRSANITPHRETGIGAWTKENFISRFKLHKDSSYVTPVVQPGEFNTIMPWTMYANMTEEDLGAIYTYLHSLAPMENRVEKFTPPSKVDVTAVSN